MLLLGAMALWPAQAQAAACHAVPIEQTGADPSEFRIGTRVIRIREPGSGTVPENWDGPIEVEDPARGTRCSIDTDLMARPLIAFEGGLLVIPNYSGSTVWLTTLDLDRCRIAHRSQGVAGRGRIVDGRLRLGSTTPAGLPCDRIAPASPPVRLERHVTTGPLAGGAERVRVDEVPALTEDTAELRVERRLALGNVAFAILRIRGRDSACPLRHRVLDLTGARAAVSPPFGCGPLAGAAIEGTTLQVTVQGADAEEQHGFTAGQVGAALR